MRIFLFIVLALTCYLNAATPKGKNHSTFLKNCPPLFDVAGKKINPTHISAQKYLILYFSASWCPPCKKFNPTFIKWYNENGGRKNFEVILVGSDDNTNEIKKYMKDAQMPWLAFEKNGKAFDEIQKKYGGNGIPCVVLLDEKDNVIAHSYKDGKYLGPSVALEKYEELTKK